jgi:hypothetical protein
MFWQAMAYRLGSGLDWYWNRYFSDRGFGASTFRASAVIACRRLCLRQSSPGEFEENPPAIAGRRGLRADSQLALRLSRPASPTREKTRLRFGQ